MKVLVSSQLIMMIALLYFTTPGFCNNKTRGKTRQNKRNKSSSISLRNLESQTITALEKHAELLNIKSFEGEPLVTRVKSNDGNRSSKTVTFISASTDQVIFTATDPKYSSNKDVIVLGSNHTSWAIPTPRGASIRQFVLLRKFRKEWSTLHEFDYYMTFVFARDPRSNESSKEVVKVNGEVEIVPEYDIWEERPRSFYYASQNCEQTVLLTCEKQHRQANRKKVFKRNVSTSSSSDDGDFDEKAKRVSLSEKTKEDSTNYNYYRPMRTINAQVGYDSDDYRDLYLDFGFHRMVDGKLQEVDEGNGGGRRRGLNEKAIEVIEEQVARKQEEEHEKSSTKKKKGANKTTTTTTTKRVKKEDTEWKNKGSSSPAPPNNRHFLQAGMKQNNDKMKELGGWSEPDSTTTNNTTTKKDKVVGGKKKKVTTRKPVIIIETTTTTTEPPISEEDDEDEDKFTMKKEKKLDKDADELEESMNDRGTIPATKAPPPPPPSKSVSKPKKGKWNKSGAAMSFDDEDFDFEERRTTESSVGLGKNKTKKGGGGSKKQMMRSFDDEMEDLSLSGGGSTSRTMVVDVEETKTTESTTITSKNENVQDIEWVSTTPPPPPAHNNNPQNTTVQNSGAQNVEVSRPDENEEEESGRRNLTVSAIESPVSTVNSNNNKPVVKKAKNKKVEDPGPSSKKNQEKVDGKNGDPQKTSTNKTSSGSKPVTKKVTKNNKKTNDRGNMNETVIPSTTESSLKNKTGVKKKSSKSDQKVNDDDGKINKKVEDPPSNTTPKKSKPSSGSPTKPPLNNSSVKKKKTKKKGNETASESKIVKSESPIINKPAMDSENDDGGSPVRKKRYDLSSLDNNGTLLGLICPSCVEGMKTLSAIMLAEETDETFGRNFTTANSRVVVLKKESTGINVNGMLRKGRNGSWEFVRGILSPTTTVKVEESATEIDSNSQVGSVVEYWTETTTINYDELEVRINDSTTEKRQPETILMKVEEKTTTVSPSFNDSKRNQEKPTVNSVMSAVKVESSVKVDLLGIDSPVAKFSFRRVEFEKLDNGKFSLIGKTTRRLPLPTLTNERQAPNGTLNLKMISSSRSPAEFSHSISSNVWDTIQFEELEESTKKLSSTIPKNWATLNVIGIGGSSMGASINHSFIQTARTNTLNGGLYRGMGFYGNHAIKSNNRLVYGAFYYWAHFFLPVGSIVKVEFKSSGISVSGYLEVGLEKTLDTFHPDNGNPGGKKHVTGMLYPHGFNHHDYKFRGIPCTFLPPNVVRFSEDKVFGFYDPKDDELRKVWVPKEILLRSTDSDHSFTRARLRTGKVPSGGSSNANIISTRKSYAAHPGYPIWSEITWTHDSHRGVLYRAGSSNLICLPFGVMVRAEFRVKNGVSIHGFYLSGQIDTFFPDDDAVISGRGYLIPSGFEGQGISGTMDDDDHNTFRCDGQKVRVSWEESLQQLNTYWAPDGAIGVMLKLNDSSVVIVPVDTRVKGEVKVDDDDHKSIGGEWLVQQSTLLLFFPQNETNMIKPGVKGRMVLSGANKWIGGEFGSNGSFNAQVDKSLVLFSRKDNYWKDKHAEVVDGVQVLTFQSGNQSIVFPSMTVVRAEYKASGSNNSVFGFFRPSLSNNYHDWFIPDNETVAEKVVHSNGTLKFMCYDYDSIQQVRCSLYSNNRVVVMMSERVKRLWSGVIDSNIMFPKGSLGLLYTTHGKTVFLREGSNTEVKFKVEGTNTTVQGNFIPRRVGHHDVLQLDGVKVEMLHGIRGFVIPGSLNHTKISGVFHAPDIFSPSGLKTHAVLNLNDQDGMSQIWVPLGMEFENVGVGSKQRGNSYYPSWKTWIGGEEDSTKMVVYELNNVVIPLDTMISAKFRVGVKYLSGLYFATNNGTDMFYPDNELLAKSFYGLKGELVLNPNLVIVRGVYKSNKMFVPDSKRRRPPPQYTPVSGVFGASYRGIGGNDIRIVFPLNTHVRVKVQTIIGNETINGATFIARESADTLNLNNNDTTWFSEKDHQLGVIVVPEGLSKRGVKGVVMKNGTFLPAKEKTKVLYDHNDHVWVDKTWTPEGSLGIVYKLPGAVTNLHLPLGIYVRAEFKTDQVQRGFFMAGETRDIFLPDDNNEIAGKSMGAMFFTGFPHPLNGTVESGGIFKHEVVKIRTLLSIDDTEGWRPEGIPGVLYGWDKGRNKAVLFPLESINVKLRCDDYNNHVIATGLLTPQHQTDKLVDTMSHVVGGNCSLIPVDLSHEGQDLWVRGVVSNGTFRSYDQRLIVLYNDDDVMMRDKVLIATGQMDVQEEARAHESSNNDHHQHNHGVKEGHVGVMYRGASGRRVWLPNRVLISAQINCGTAVNGSGGFFPTMPDHPDTFYPDSSNVLLEQWAINGLKCRVVPTGFNYEDGFDGTLRESKLFHADVKKIKSVYAAGTGVLVPKGVVGVVYYKPEMIFVPVDSIVRATFTTNHNHSSNVSGDFVASQQGPDHFFPDDDLEGLIGSNVQTGHLTFDQFSTSLPGLLNDKVFESTSQKATWLVDHSNPVWKNLTVIEETEEGVSGVESLLDTRWTWVNVVGNLYDVNKDESKLMFHPHDTMVWCKYKVDDKLIFGFHFSSNDPEQPDRFLPDSDSFVDQMVGMTEAVVIHTGSDLRIPALLENIEILNIQVPKYEVTLSWSDLMNDQIHVSDGVLGILYFGASETKQFFFQYDTSYRVVFQFGDNRNNSVPGTFIPKDPGLTDVFIPDDVVLAYGYYGSRGLIIPSGFIQDKQQRFGIDAVYESGTIVTVKEDHKSKVVVDVEDPVWKNKIWVSPGTAGWLYGNTFVPSGTLIRGEFKSHGGGHHYSGFFVANPYPVHDDFQLEGGDHDDDDDVKTGEMVLDGGGCVIQGKLRGRVFMHVGNTKKKMVVVPNDRGWKVCIPQGIPTLLYEDDGSRNNKKQFMVEQNQLVRGVFKVGETRVWGMLKPNGPGHADMFVPDDESEAAAVIKSHGLFVPEPFVNTKSGIAGQLIERNRFVVAGKKMKGLYNPDCPAWRLRVLVPPGSHATKKRAATTPTGKKLIYGYLFQGIENSPHMFVAEGDSLTGFFIPQDEDDGDEERGEGGVMLHGVLTPTHPAGYAIFLPDSANNQLEFIKETRGSFLVDALGLTGGFNGVLSLISSTTTKQYMFVLDIPAIEYVYVVGSREVRDLWSIYLKREDWKFELSHLGFSTSHVAKRQVFGVNARDVDTTSSRGGKKKKRKNMIQRGRSLDQHDDDDDNVSVSGVGVKLVTSKSVVFIPNNFTMIGVVTCEDSTGNLISAYSDLVVVVDKSQTIFWISIRNSSETFKPRMTGSEGLFIPQNFPHGDAIMGKLSFAPDFKSGNFTTNTTVTPHTWNVSQAIWIPVGGKEFMGSGYSQDAEQDAKNDYAADNPVDINEAVVPGVVKLPLLLPPKPRNFRFGPLYSSSSSRVPEFHENPLTRFVPGVFIKAVESIDPVFIPSGGAKIRFYPLNLAYSPVSGQFVHQKMRRLEASFDLENGTNNIPAGVKGKVQLVLPDGSLSEAFFFAKIGSNNTIRINPNVEILEGWERTDKPSTSVDSIVYSFIDLACGFKGVVVVNGDLIESMADPNNPLFQAYLIERAQQLGDVNPWGTNVLVLVDPVVRTEPGSPGRIPEHNSMVNDIMKNFELKREVYRVSKEPLRIGNRVNNVVNLLDFRLFLYSKFNVKKTLSSWVYIPVQSEICSVGVVREAKDSITKPVGMVEPDKYFGHGFAAWANIDHDDLKRYYDSDNSVHQPSTGVANYMELNTIQRFQIKASKKHLEKSPTREGAVNDLKKTAQDFIEKLEIKKKAAAAKKSSSQNKVQGRSTAGFVAEKTQDDNHVEESQVNVSPGWKTQNRKIQPNVTLTDVGKVFFYGLGNCDQKQAPEDKMLETGTPRDVIEYFLNLFRVQCVDDARGKLLGLMNDGYLEFDSNARYFRISRSVKSTNALKLTPKELSDLGVAFEFYASTRTYHHCRNNQVLKGPVLTEPHCVISRSVGYLTEFSYYVIQRATKVAPAHATRVIRNLLAVLRTVLSKLHEDWLALQDCKACDFDRTIVEGDKFRVVSLIEFIINGLRAYHSGQEKSVKNSFREFVTLNLEALKERGDGFGALYARGG